MPTLIAGIVAVALIYVALNVIKGADPKFLARVVRSGGGILALAFAAFIGARGEIAVAIPIAVFGAGLLGWSPFGAKLGSAFGNWGGSSRRSNGQQSQVRSKFIEMTLDHDTGALEGRLTAGPEAGRVLDDFSLDELLALARGFDGESSAEEAYQILGLQSGASREEIGRAHRSLMKKLHPDQGGSTYLAARVNEAKDTLLRTHRS